MNSDQVIAILQEHRKELAELGVAKLELFGSVARGEQRDDSDVDLLVEFNRRYGLLHFAGVQQYLEDILGVSVDLVPRDSLRPELRDDVLSEAVLAA